MQKDQLRIWERSLGSQLSKLANKRLGHTVTLIEVVDASEVWTDAIQQIPAALVGLDFPSLLERYPVLGCAAASEIGFRFEGVGTVFWGRFEALLGRPIPVSQRPLLAQAFANLAERFALQRPSESGFSSQFSIIAWPIANALMPYELASPVGRLLSRGPVAGLAATNSGRHADLSQLRAWAQSWEGARLADWLQPAGAAGRVIAALLTDNAKTVISSASYLRVRRAFLHHSEAYFALRDARRRRRTPNAADGADGTDAGHLSLQMHGQDLLLSVSWGQLPQDIADQGRSEASAHGWRPKLWGQARTAAENVFGSLPITLRLSHLPSGRQPTYPDAGSVFGEDSRISRALLRRIVDWDGPLAFLRDGDRAERVDLPVSSSSEELWIIDRDDRFAELPRLGNLGGTSVRRAKLAEPAHRELLVEQAWLQEGANFREAIARHPIDALTLPGRYVSANTSFCLFHGDELRIQHLRPREKGAHGVAIGAPRALGPASPGVFLFERETAFDALTEQRLLLRMQSSIPGARWPVEVMLTIDDEILAYASDELAEDTHGLSKTSKLLTSLQADHVRQRILHAGRANLMLRVGRHPWETIALKRQDGDVDWTQVDPSQSLTRPAVEVVALAKTPFRFLSPPVPNFARLRTYRFEDGRLASPGLIDAPDQFRLGDLNGNFNDIEGRRRLRSQGGGVLDLARARRSWATAQAGSLAALAARTRVVQQFDGPLVAALCGPEWRRLEQLTPAQITPDQVLFDRIVPFAVGDQLGNLDAIDQASFASQFALAISAACPQWTEDGAVDDERADQALSDAFSAMLSDAQLQGRMLDIHVDDIDFGASPDQWRAAVEAALNAAALSPLVSLIAPTSGAKVLAKRQFAGANLAEVSTFLVDWITQWCLPRSQIDLDLACDALQFWLAPNAANPETGALVAMSRDMFLARAVRFISRRMNPADR